jgi:hypothetical protein
MSLHADWSSAKKRSKAFFKDALEAKKEKLAKDAKGDAKEKEKAVDKKLDAEGLGNGADLDKYFSFKEEFGPTLDKLEDAGDKNGGVRKAAAGIAGVDDLLRDSKMWAAFGEFCKKTYRMELWNFVEKGWKLDPAKAYEEYVKDGARQQINISAPLRKSFDDIAEDAAALKSRGPDLLRKCREYLIGSHRDIALEFARGDAFHETAGRVDVDALLTKVRSTIASYRKQIEAAGKTWKGIKPDFCYPLETELTKIEYAVDKIEKAQKR